MNNKLFLNIQGNNKNKRSKKIHVNIYSLSNNESHQNKGLLCGVEKTFLRVNVKSSV